MKIQSQSSWQRRLPWLAVLASLACAAALTQAAHASNVTTIWGNSAGDSLDEWSLTNGAQLMHIDPAAALGLNSWNGRGVVQVGNTLYVTSASSNDVYMINATTGAGEGVAFSVAGTSALSTISYNGTNFWIADYSGTNNAYLYSPTGTLLQTISLSNATGYMDGLLYFNNGSGGQLISNRSDGCCTTPTYYDLYNLSGTATTTPFITANTESTGSAYDGTNFWASNIYQGSLSEYSGTNGSLMSTLDLQNTIGGSFLVEGLSVNYTAVLPPPASVPEPSTLALFGLGLAAVGLVMLRRRNASGRAH